MSRLGVFLFATDYSISPREAGLAAESRDLESLFIPEHTHVPTARKTPYPGGGDLPREYAHIPDPFVELAAVAAVTERIKLGTGICLIPEHDPIVLGKTIATLDQVAQGRFILGIGAGWNQEELEDHGNQFQSRWPITREYVLAMRTMWNEQEPSFRGEFVDFEPMWHFPKPARAGGPPVLLGAQSKWAYERVVDYCDGWIPISRGDDVTPLAQGLEEIRGQAEKVGRDMAELDLSCFVMEPNEDHCRALLDLGFGRLLCWLGPEEPDEAIKRLDEFARLAEKLG